MLLLLKLLLLTLLILLCKLLLELDKLLTVLLVVLVNDTDWPTEGNNGCGKLVSKLQLSWVIVCGEDPVEDASTEELISVLELLLPTDDVEDGGGMAPAAPSLLPSLVIADTATSVLTGRPGTAAGALLLRSNVPDTDVVRELSAARGDCAGGSRGREDTSRGAELLVPLLWKEWALES